MALFSIQLSICIPNVFCLPLPPLGWGSNWCLLNLQTDRYIVQMTEIFSISNWFLVFGWCRSASLWWLAERNIMETCDKYPDDVIVLGSGSRQDSLRWLTIRLKMDQTTLGWVNLLDTQGKSIELAWGHPKIIYSVWKSQRCLIHLRGQTSDMVRL